MPPREGSDCVVEIENQAAGTRCWPSALGGGASVFGQRREPPGEATS